MAIYDLFALILSFFTLFIYFVVGVRRSPEILKMDDFFFYGRRLDKKGYESTFIVTGISLATVLFFFLDYGGVFGLPLILSPIMFCLGTYIFYKILPILNRAGFLHNGSTLHNFIGTAYNFKTLRYSSAIISILGYLGMFVIELYVGIEVFQILFPDPFWRVIITLFLMSLIFIYVYMGGYKAVVDTDRIQLALIFFATTLALIALIYLNFTLPKQNPVNIAPYKGLLPISFIVVMIVGNVPFQILRMAHWQRAAAVGNIEIIQDGLKHSIVWTFIIWLIFSVIGMLLFWVTDINGSGAIALLELFRNNILPYNYIIYPLLFTGFIAALISTADSIFISILTSYIYDFKHYEMLHDKNGNSSIDLSESDQAKGLKSTKQSILFILIVGGVFYYLLVEVFKFEFIDLLFVFFNQQLSLFPAVVLALRSKNGNCKDMKYPVLIAMWVGWIIVWIISIYGKNNNKHDLVLYAAMIGWIASILITFFLSPIKTIKIIWGKT